MKYISDNSRFTRLVRYKLYHTQAGRCISTRVYLHQWTKIYSIHAACDLILHKHAAPTLEQKPIESYKILKRVHQSLTPPKNAISRIWGQICANAPFLLEYI